jgi:hypothetical protein
VRDDQPTADRRRWHDAWLSATQELIVGCVLLVVSGWWWFSMQGAIWQGWHNVLATVATVLGPRFVYRAWKRGPEDVPWPSRAEAFAHGYRWSEATKLSQEPVLLKVELASPDGVETVTEQRIWRATICPVCFAVHGRLVIEGLGRGPYEQRCRCQVDVEPQGRWPGFDFNTYLELCHCCAIEPLRSGSRWSPFFCSECRDRVVSFNRRHRRWVIPIGRHSMMHGDFLGGDEAAIEEHAEHFVLRVRGLFAATDHLDEWTSERVKQNLKTLGCAAGQEVDLAWYLTAARTRPLEKQTAFCSLREHFIRPADPDG